ncbi:MAG: LysM peptidoglycan-binding domain-containing M23 family metallopeptidase [Alphaproteobacteria bacterium]|nr:LysM peptidoglycan-binding domain-containing M23 family metallopeptidase [Alphaproteobacteria bacterium]MDE2340107.1 LysM peptidoglycan-binding domain-containing M23 family metallopeptidase [Alphaproteobacteria bacterium]
MMRRGAPLLLLALAGCIPPGAPLLQSKTPPPSPTRIAPDAELTPEPPVWEAHPADVSTIDVTGGTYTVQHGDTLHSVGEKTQVGWEVLARANNLTLPVNLVPGQQLTIPAGHYHIVRSGESGIAIARAHHVHWTEIVALNGLTEPYVIHTNQRLLLPAGDSHASLPPVAAPATQPPASIAPKPPAQDAMEARAAAFNLDDVVQGGGEPAQDAGAQVPRHQHPTLLSPLPATSPVPEPKHFSDGTFAWPLHGSIATRFGGNSHGIDITAQPGSIVNAAASGVVAFDGPVAGYGGTIILRHGDGWLTIYSHLARISVTRGEAVRRGSAIGISGGADVHFEIRQHKTPIDPMRKLGHVDKRDSQTV